MKTLTEFPSSVLKKAAQLKAELTTGGKTPEEISQSMSETLKIEGDKLSFLMNALEVIGNKQNDLKRVVVYTLSEGEKVSGPVAQKGEHAYLAEFYPSLEKPKARAEMDHHPGGDRSRGKGGRGKGRGGPGNQNGGSNRGPGAGRGNRDNRDSSGDSRDAGSRGPKMGDRERGRVQINTDAASSTPARAPSGDRPPRPPRTPRSPAAQDTVHRGIITPKDGEPIHVQAKPVVQPPAKKVIIKPVDAPKEPEQLQEQAQEQAPKESSGQKEEPTSL